MIWRFKKTKHQFSPLYSHGNLGSLSIFHWYSSIYAPGIVLLLMLTDQNPRSLTIWYPIGSMILVYFFTFTMKINHSRRQIFVPWILFVGMVGMVFAMNPKLLGPKISPQKCLGKEDDPYEVRIGVLCCLDLYLQFAQDSDSKKKLYVINVIPVVTGNWQVAYNQSSMYLSIWENYYSKYTWIHGIWGRHSLTKTTTFST